MSDGISDEDRINANESVRLLDNSKTVLWDIDQDDLTDRESDRLSTILRKIDELREIRADRIRQESADE